MTIQSSVLLLILGVTEPALARDSAYNPPVDLATASATKLTTDSGIADLKTLISGVIGRFEQNVQRDWSYRISRYENEEGDISSSEELFDPTQTPDRQWHLLSINGHTPADKQLRKYTAEKLKQANSDQQNTISLKLSKIIQFDSLELVSEDPIRLQASFKVYLRKLGEDASKKLQGQLSFDKTKQYIESIDITNNAHFSPLLGTTIDDFRLTLRFIQINGVMLPQQQEMTMKGTFAYFTGIDEISTDTFSDYRYISK